ncbi:MAG: hypothetical protein ICV79_24740, partial [Flavisolibacter sp.]|nr:hypothetical protein [Flavisolibacter sp.]
MLTHGWRRFQWPAVFENKAPVFPPEYKGHLGSASITDEKGQPIRKDTVGFLSVPGKNFQFYTAKTDSAGVLRFYTKDVIGPHLLVGQVQQGNMQLNFLNPFSEKISSRPVPPFTLSDAQLPKLLQRSVQMQVQNIYGGEKISTRPLNLKDTLPFYGKADVVYNLDDYTRFPTMEDVMREYIREVNVRKQKEQFELILADKDRFGIELKQRSPAVLLDGVLL